MRIELEQIEKTERYLLDAMSTNEKAEFENQIALDSKLKENVEAQKNVMAGIQRFGLMMSTKKAYTNWRRKIWFRRIGLSLLIIGAIFSTAFFWPGNGEEGGDCPCYEYEKVHDPNVEGEAVNSECCIIPLENHGEHESTHGPVEISDTTCLEDSISFIDVEEEVNENIEFDANGNLLNTNNSVNNDLELPEDNEQVLASYPGGTEAMYAFLQENIIYPQVAADNNESGIVYVEFVVNSDGSISNSKVTKGVSSTIDKEAIRVVNLMPKWNPATIGGVPTTMSYTAPIQFLLAE